ncbi:hypothetical protein, partial [Pseudoalteromonas sp. SIMBA_162]|uniref:hypothetical protein n=1 Tax=Pseudoalteromonas sp. SIMBA_162 TaxID=3080867 RepID=UPI00397B76F9
MTEEFSISERLMLIEAPDVVRREQMRALIDKLFPHLKADIRREIEKELESYPAAPEPVGLSPSFALQSEEQEPEEDDSSSAQQWV